MAFSYSFHLSSKSHAVSTVGKVGQVSRHNLREYKSADYDRGLIEILAGDNLSIANDVKRIYHQEFDRALEKYNAGKRADRKIDDYLQHVSDSRSDVAAEIIIQVGDRDFWLDKSMDERRQMTYIFKDQLRTLEKLVPEFKVASAVVHYDEASPHMHVIGVPVAEGYNKGLEKQVAKTKVFTADRLTYLQEKMRDNAERGLRLPQNQNLFAGIELKNKAKGRNKDIPKKSLDEFYKVEQARNQAQYELKKTVLAQKMEGNRLNALANASKRLSDPSRSSDVIINTPEGEKAFTPLPELQRRVLRLQGDISTQESQFERNNGLLERQKGILEEQAEQFDKKQELLEEKSRLLESLDRVADKIRTNQFKISTEQIGGILDRHEVTVVEGIRPKELERVFQRASIADSAAKIVDHAENEANNILEQAQSQAQEQLKQAQDTINQAGRVLNEEAARKRKLDEYEKQVKIENRELSAQNQELSAQNGRLHREYAAYVNGWTDKEGNHHPGVGALKNEIWQTQARLNQVKEELQEVTGQVVEKLAVVDVELSPSDLRQMLNDSLISNIVQETMLETCKQLHERGLLEKSPEYAFIQLNKTPIIERFKSHAQDFIQNVKVHMEQIIENFSRGRSR